MRAAVLTVSDGVARGEREDRSGDTLEALLAADGYDVARPRAPDPLRAARQDRAHRLRASVRLRRRAALRAPDPGRARPRLDHTRDSRSPLARDGAQPADRRAHRRAEPPHRLPRAPFGPAQPAPGGRLLPARARPLPARRLPARPDRALAVADPGRRVRGLPVPEALHLALPPLARRDRRARARWRLGCDHRPSAVAGLGARCRRRALGGGLRPLLLALRHAGRPRAGAALHRRPLRRPRGLPRRAARAPRDGRAPRRRRRGSPPRPRVLDRARRRLRALPLRALTRPARRPAPPRRRVLHRERRPQRRLLRLRPRRGGLVIRARAVEKRYGDKRVLRGLDLDVPRGGFAVVTGANGSGKTTLLRLVVGLAQPTAGELEVGVPRGRVGFLAHEPLAPARLAGLATTQTALTR